MIITKGIDSWPVNSKTEVQTGTIDLWWIIHDGGLLLLIVFLLKKHKIWQKCKLRLFTVAKENEHSLQIKNDLVQYMYYLRIDAEVDVIEMVPHPSIYYSIYHSIVLLVFLYMSRTIRKSQPIRTRRR